ncbi:hypothetical protein HYT91_00870 [Candidatus Pacearchaeota archaeon]|nr:hypothetical protein [Candidatus Pacearchaeota archaeon]
MEKKGQLTIFIIIAILIVASFAGYFLVKGKIATKGVPANIQQIETAFLSCLEDEVLTGADVLESQGGYIELPEFEPGSDFMPFSSQLNFLGNPIPYWYYVSGNNIKKEQIPSKEFMEGELEKFIDGKIQNCNLEKYYQEGYKISIGAPESNVIIRDKDIKVELKMDLGINFGEESAIINEHNKIVESNLGNLYDAAKSVYEHEQNNLFLEKYAVDNLRSYAPVDGVEISCSPLHWNADEVFAELGDNIETNTLALRNQGKENNYFVVDLPVSSDYEVRFINSQEWARAFEVEPSEENLLLATPVGNQPDLGILGFCYVPYHFVYNIKYPVLVQISKDQETFQFPMAVVIQGNNPREPLNATASEAESIELCENKNTKIKINVFDSNSKPVDAEISYECFGESCIIGETSSGSLESDFPQCVNGFVAAKAKGFKKTQETFSTIQDGSSLSIYLDRVYELPINLKLDGADYNGEAIINFISEDDISRTIVYPEQKVIGLSEGFYDVRVQIYKDSSFELSKTTQEQCVDIPVGIFGLTKKKCFDIEFPAQLVSKALAGGGTQEYYLLESELAGANSLEINVESLPVPDTIEKIQDNNLLFEIKPVRIVFR